MPIAHAHHRLKARACVVAFAFACIGIRQRQCGYYCRGKAFTKSGGVTLVDQLFREPVFGLTNCKSFIDSFQGAILHPP